MQLKDYLEKYDTLKNIKRFNMETVSESQNLCDHGHGVGTLYYLLCRELGVLMSVDTLFMVMNHDFAEAYTSDLNRRVKEKNKETSEAWKIIEKNCLPSSLICWTDENINGSLGNTETSVRQYVFQIADELEAMLYCLREVRKGNTYMKRPLMVYMGLVNEKLLTLGTWSKNYEECCNFFIAFIERIDVEYGLGVDI